MIPEDKLKPCANLHTKQTMGMMSVQADCFFKYPEMHRYCLEGCEKLEPECRGYELGPVTAHIRNIANHIEDWQ